MDDYQKIFHKYGLTSPALSVPPSIASILSHVNYLKATGYEESSTNQFLYAILVLSLSPYKHFYISDIDSFSSSFNINIDQSRLHPDFIRSFKIYPNLVRDKLYLFERVRSLFYEVSEKDAEVYLSHFNPAYPLQKMFSNEVADETKEELLKYTETVFSSELDKVDLSDLLSEVYDYILRTSK